MTAIDTVRRIMENHDISLNELYKYEKMVTDVISELETKRGITDIEF